jgi:hypothetical protein
MYNSYLDFTSLAEETKLIIHGNRLNDIVERYIDKNE